MVVVESQCRQVRHPKPSRLSGIRRGAYPMITQFDQCIVGNTDHSLTWVPVNSAEAVQLLEIHPGNPGFLLKFTKRRLFQGFIDMHEAPRKGPLPGVRCEVPLDE